MWIIPSNLSTSHSAQGMEELTWDSLELSQMLSQSVMWRSKHSAATTWSKRLKRVSWLQHLSGQILKPSLGQSFVEEWISSQEAFLVSHLVPQDSKREMKIHDTSGPILSEGLKSLIDLPLFSWRMSWGSSVQDLKVTNGQTRQAHQFCFMSLENWKGWVIKQKQVYSQRLKLEHLTRGNACLSWRVAPILASQDALLFQQCSETQGCLTLQVQHTQLQEAQSSTHGSHQGSQWRTPDVGTKNHMSSNHLYYESREQKGKQPSLNGQCVMAHRQKTQTLNPRWVEALMGLPIGWTMPSCVNPWIIEQMNSECLEMESSQPQPREHLESCGVDWKTPMSADSQGGTRRYIESANTFYKLRDQVTWPNKV